MASQPVWYGIPKAMSSLDVLLVPLDKSEANKYVTGSRWIEASLSKTVTVAGNMDVFQSMIKNGETGFLCDNETEWDTVLEMLIRDCGLRNAVSNRAYEFVVNNYRTIDTGRRIAGYIRKLSSFAIAFCLQTTDISGGVIVSLNHACLLHRKGYSITFIVNDPARDWMEYGGKKFPVIKAEKCIWLARFDKMIATLWSTVSFVEKYPRVMSRFYLVQGYETNFYSAGKYSRTPCR